jgi:hypothetical protein
MTATERPAPGGNGVTAGNSAGCGAPEQQTALADLGIDLTKESVIQGVVTRGGDPVGGAYVRLLDRTGEFAAEVATSTAGAFRFFAAPGQWTLRTLAPPARRANDLPKATPSGVVASRPTVQPADLQVQARSGEVTEVTVTLAG